MDFCSLQLKEPTLTPSVLPLILHTHWPNLEFLLSLFYSALDAQLNFLFLPQSPSWPTSGPRGLSSPELLLWWMYVSLGCRGAQRRGQTHLCFSKEQCWLLWKASESGSWFLCDINIHFTCDENFWVQDPCLETLWGFQQLEPNSKAWGLRLLHSPSHRHTQPAPWQNSCPCIPEHFATAILRPIPLLLLGTCSLTHSASLETLTSWNLDLASNANLSRKQTFLNPPLLLPWNSCSDLTLVHPCSSF